MNRHLGARETQRQPSACSPELAALCGPEAASWLVGGPVCTGPTMGPEDEPCWQRPTESLWIRDRRVPLQQEMGNSRCWSQTRLVLCPGIHLLFLGFAPFGAWPVDSMFPKTICISLLHIVLVWMVTNNAENNLTGLLRVWTSWEVEVAGGGYYLFPGQIKMGLVLKGHI